MPPLEPIYLREPQSLMPKDGNLRCWAEIDRSALRHNAKIVRERVGSAPGPWL